jgi:hypothetical protein
MRFVSSITRGAAIAVAALVLACTKPIAQERMAYVGDWQAKNMRLTITAAGEVHYLRVNGSARKSIDAPLKSFEGDDFIVGVGPLTTKFVVSSPPHRDGNVWKMTVDGVEVVRGVADADSKA